MIVIEKCSGNRNHLRALLVIFYKTTRVNFTIPSPLRLTINIINHTVMKGAETHLKKWREGCCGHIDLTKFGVVTK